MSPQNLKGRRAKRGTNFFKEQLLFIYNMSFRQLFIHCITEIWPDNIYLKKLQLPSPLVIESWSSKTKICTELVISDGPSVSSKIFSYITSSNFIYSYGPFQNSSFSKTCIMHKK